MANKTMKTLTIGDNTYEIYDDFARKKIETMVVDSTISDTSTNPVQNNIVKKYIDNSFNNFREEILGGAW